MALNAPKILTIRFEPSEPESLVVFEFGAQTMEKKIPRGHGVLRASAIIHGDSLSDVELITQQTA